MLVGTAECDVIVQGLAWAVPLSSHVTSEVVLLFTTLYLWGLIVSQDPRASKLLCLRQAPVCLQSLFCPFSAVPISLSGISSDLLSFLPKSHGILDRLQSSLCLKSLLSQRMKATSTLWYCYIKPEDTWTLPDIKKERKKHHHGSLLCYFLPRQTSQKWRLRTKGDVNCVTLRAFQP